MLHGAAADGTAFLDAPGLDAGAVFDTVERVLSDMPDGAILTVYADDPAVQRQAQGWCADHDVELLAVIGHQPDGTTLALRRRGRPGGSAFHPTTGGPGA
jgi:TusA-related sulfurtransferase